MDTKTTLESAITAAISRPMAYPEIEKAVGKQDGFALGITLTNMVLAKRLHYAEPKSYTAEWPVYSNAPIPKRFQFPKRSELTPNNRI